MHMHMLVSLCAHTPTHVHSCGNLGRDAIQLAIARGRSIVKMKDSPIWRKEKQDNMYKLKPRAPIRVWHLNAADLSSLVRGSKGYVFIYINKMLLRNILFPEHLAS